MNSVVQFLKRLAQILFFLVVVVFLGSLLIGVGGLERYPNGLNRLGDSRIS